MDIHDFARRMPKVELHVHLEGSTQPATLLQLAERNGIALPAKTEAELQAFYRFEDFSQFVEVYITITRCLCTQDDYRLIAYEFGRECARQNVRYAEVTFSIATNTWASGLPWQAIMEGLNDGRAQAQREFGVDWSWVFDIVRNNPETQDEVTGIALAARELGVVALGLGGSELEFPPHLFKRSFERALQAGLPRVPHAGETAGPKSVWDALNLLHADRIGHGVRSIEDPALVAHLGERRIPIELCPTSNIRLSIYPSYAEHPLRQLWDAGLLVTINSDDPPMFGTDLNQEYLALVDHFGFTCAELEQASLNGLQASLLPADEKNRLAETFRREFEALHQELDSHG